MFLELLQVKVVPRKDALIQRLYAALRIINSVRHLNNFPPSFVWQINFILPGNLIYCILLIDDNDIDHWRRLIFISGVLFHEPQRKGGVHATFVEVFISS